MSSGKGCETRMNTEARVFQSQSESIAEMGCSATLNRQVVGSIPTASTNQNQQLEGGATTVAITSCCWIMVFVPKLALPSRHTGRRLFKNGIQKAGKTGIEILAPKRIE